MTQRSNQSTIHVVAQPTKGTPSVVGMTTFDTTSGRLNKTTSFFKSQTIRGDGQSSPNIRDAVTLNSEFAFEVNQDIALLLASALRINSMPSLVSNTSSNLVYTHADTEITDSSATIDFSAYKKDAFVFIDGMAFYVTAVSATGLIVNPPKDAADINFPVDSKLNQRVYRSGKSANYLTFQEREEDTSGVGTDDISYTTQIDCIVNTLSLTIPTSGGVTATAGIVAGSQLDGYKKPAGQSGDITYEPTRGASNLDTSMRPDHKASGNTAFTDLTIDISSNSEAIQAAGYEGALDNTINTITVGGSLNSIGQTTDPRKEANKKDSGETFGFSVVITFPDTGEMLAISMQQMIYTDGSRGREFDTVAAFSGTYDAETKTTVGSTISVETSY